ncbi:MAG: hypothetical protein EON59_07245 [Alphaproteobacteria bacterium]|nr:MAG: hypothetical protein EON59_07245 [Alphaproteobacteria bacterium]
MTNPSPLAVETDGNPTVKHLNLTLDVVDVPEQGWVTAMTALVVGHWATRCRVLASADRAGALALEGVADEDLHAEALPSCGLVPGAPRGQLIAALVCCLGVTLGRTDAGSEAAYGGVEVGELAYCAIPVLLMIWCRGVGSK